MSRALFQDGKRSYGTVHVTILRRAIGMDDVEHGRYRSEEAAGKREGDIEKEREKLEVREKENGNEKESEK